jgi:hypothetical protein
LTCKEDFDRHLRYPSVIPFAVGQQAMQGHPAGKKNAAGTACAKLLRAFILPPCVWTIAVTVPEGDPLLVRGQIIQCPLRLPLPAAGRVQERRTTTIRALISLGASPLDFIFLCGIILPAMADQPNWQCS